MNDLAVKFVGRKSRGFTLVEIMVASVIGAFIAAVTVGTLKAVSASAQMVNDNIEAAAEMRFASKRITTDLVNLYRDVDFRNTKFIGFVDSEQAGSRLIFYTVNRAKARAAEPEGDVYEVEYYITADDEKSYLMRRVWPNPEKDIDGSGILTTIAEGIDIFNVRYFDGQQWVGEWDEERRNVPELVEVTFASKPGEKKEAVMKSFFVNFVRGGGGEMENFEPAQSEES